MGYSSPDIFLIENRAILQKKELINIFISYASIKIVKWLKDYALNSKSKGFVIGISGGVDSAVTSTLCAQTGLDVLCIEMPIHQDPTHVSRAQEHIKNLQETYKNVKSLRVDLTPTFDLFANSLDLEGYTDDKINFSLANSRARLRMTTLYFYAGINGLLVTGTGNKVEDFGVGFFTKYGDGGVDLSPIADLMKSEVYKLAKFLDVSKSILEAAPTDGLFGNSRTDEQQLGATYDELEWAMLEVESLSFSPMYKLHKQHTDREKEVLKIYTERHNANRHKMVEIPVCKIN